jgi:para-nitrobenzyl esterase
MESGVTISGVANGIEPMTREVMYDQTRQMAEALCPGAADVLGCLRAVPADQIMPFRPAATAREGILWAPVIEGAGGVLPEHPDALIASGSFNEGEVLVGTNKNEYGLFILGGGAITTVAGFTADVEQRFGARASEVLALYAPATDADARQAQIDLMTDIMFRCATRSFARALEAAGVDVYLYSFEQGNAWHADELGYVFGPGFYGLDLANPVASLSETIQGYWTSFAADGDPNAQGLPAWPKYDAVGDQHLTLAAPPSTGSGLREQACDFWDGYLAATR